MKKRGMTLAELMITISLTFMLGMCVFWVILPSFRIAAEGQIRTELQQQGELALQQLGVDLQNSVPTGVSLVPPNSTQGMIVSTNPLTSPMSTSGQLAFDQCLYIWFHELNKSQLFRKRFQDGDPPGVTLGFSGSRPMQPSGVTLATICAASTPRTKSYALSVTNFLVEKEATTGGEVYALRIILSKVIPGKNRSAVVELFRKVMLRNHY